MHGMLTSRRSRAPWRTDALTRVAAIGPTIYLDTVEVFCRTRDTMRRERRNNYEEIWKMVRVKNSAGESLDVDRVLRFYE